MFLGRYWMDNVYCDGKEEEISLCRFDGWGQNDCTSTEAAGVICAEPDKLQERRKDIYKTSM